jgi:hypothetical protein
MSTALFPTALNARVDRRRLMVRPRPLPPGRIWLLVGAMILAPLVGLLFAEGYAVYAQQIVLFVAISVLLVWISRNSGNVYAASGLLAARVATVLIASFYIEPYYLSATGSDAELYHSVGVQVSQSLLMSGRLPVTGLDLGTNNYSLYTGICYLLFGPSRLAVKLVNTGVGAIGSILFYKTYVSYYGRANRILQFLLFFSPTLLYWSSIHGKDPLTFFSLGLGFWGTAKFAKERSKRGFFACLFAALCLFLIRPHVACVYLAALSTVFVVHSLAEKKSPGTKLASLACLTLVILAANFVVHNYLQEEMSSPAAIFERVSARHDALDAGNSAIEVPTLMGWKGVLAYLPSGAATVMFRPLPWESGGLLLRLTSLDQLALTVAELVFFGHLLFRALNGSSRRRGLVSSGASIDALTVFVAAYATGFVLLFTYLAGNLGTLAREKIQLAPFVWCGAFAVVSRYRTTEQK